MIFVPIFLYIIILLIMAVKNTMRIWCSWCSIADFSSACTGSSPVIRYLNVYSLLLDIMFWRIMLWLVVMALGGGMIFYSGALTEKLWRIRWAEEKMWWTMLMRIYVWFWLVVIWWLIMFWIISLMSPTSVNVGWI